MVIGREKVGSGAIKKMRTQGEIATKPKPVEEKTLKKKKKKHKIPSVYYRRRTQNYYKKKKKHPKL